MGVSLLENAGFSLSQNFAKNNPDLNKDTFNAAFDQYMTTFHVTSIAQDLNTFITENPDKKQLVLLAVKMIAPAEKRPNIDEVIASLEAMPRTDEA